VKEGDSGRLKKAGVGVGIYYDGKGYPKDWTADSAREFVQYVADQGGSEIDVFRLAENAAENWPREEFWWEVLTDFATGKM
jgi:hypothetical protein